MPAGFSTPLVAQRDRDPLDRGWQGDKVDEALKARVRAHTAGRQRLGENS